MMVEKPMFAPSTQPTLPIHRCCHCHMARKALSAKIPHPTHAFSPQGAPTWKIARRSLSSSKNTRYFGHAHTIALFLSFLVVQLTFVFSIRNTRRERRVFGSVWNTGRSVVKLLLPSYAIPPTEGYCCASCSSTTTTFIISYIYFG